jgi:2'-hydroxyisoflavone reductase
MFNRREFLSITGLGLAGLGLGSVSSLAEQTKQLKILVLGGTDFMGPTLVTELLARDHTVTLFNRGITNPHLFPELEKRQKAPRCVRDTAQLLRGQIGQYQYVSSIAVYKDFSQVGVTETARLSDVPAMPEEYEVDMRYFVRKTLSELTLMETLPDTHAIFRSHGMRSDRIPVPGDEPYWPVRVARGGEVLAPDTGETPIQYTDVVSLCRFMAHCAEDRISDVFNVMIKRGAYSLKDYLDKNKTVTVSDARFTWVPRAFLETQDIKPYRDLPMWRPEPAGFYNFNADKALGAGLENRPVENTITDMLAGYRRRHPNDEFRFGLEPHHGTISMEVERDVLEAWHKELAA